MVCIGGPNTLVPKDFKLFLCNDENKTQLMVFLLSQWKLDSYAKRLFGRKFFFVCRTECWCLESADGITTSSTLVKALCSTQEEAYTRIVLHCQYADKLLEAGDMCLVVKSPDTDVLVILVSYPFVPSPPSPFLSPPSLPNSFPSPLPFPSLPPPLPSASDETCPALPCPPLLSPPPPFK